MYKDSHSRFKNIQS